MATTTYRSRVDPVNVGQMERWLSMVAGGMLAAWGLKRRDTIGGTAALGAAELLYRGATGHCHVYRRSESIVGAARAPASSPTRTRTRGSGWADPAAFTWKRRSPSTGRSLTCSGSGGTSKTCRSSWSISNRSRCARRGSLTGSRKDPAWSRVEWDARIINELDNRLIAWQSLEGSTISTAGSVNFDVTEHGTRVRVNLQYNPPGGRIGAAVARLFGEEPHQTIREDLRRFKRLLETGEIPTTKGSRVDVGRQCSIRRRSSPRRADATPRRDRAREAGDEGRLLGRHQPDRRAACARSTLLNPRDAIVRITSTAICGSDLHCSTVSSRRCGAATSSVTSSWESSRRSARGQEPRAWRSRHRAVPDRVRQLLVLRAEAVFVLRQLESERVDGREAVWLFIGRVSSGIRTCSAGTPVVRRSTRAFRSPTSGRSRCPSR